MHRAWAEEEFGHVGTGDLRRTKRLVVMATGAAEVAGGTITKVFRRGDERQAAYKLLENEAVTAQAVVDGVGEAAALRGVGSRFLVVPVDGTSLNITDRSRNKGLGSIGAYSQGASGLKVITSYALDETGVPLGCLDMQYWPRPFGHPKPRASQPPEEKETRFWLQTLHAALERQRRKAPDSPAWFQIDREADGWPILKFLVEEKAMFTIRANHNRRVRLAARLGYLRERLRSAKVVGRRSLIVWDTKRKVVRHALMEVAVAEGVEFDIRNKRTEKHFPLVMNVVRVREVSACGTPLEWTLLTNASVATRKAAYLVVENYALRWRIEEFHKTWKSGRCNVEDTQLRSVDAIIKWATILAAVSARAERLKLLSRSQGETPASSEFTRDEIDAIRIVRFEEKWAQSPADPTLAEAVRWLADIGGYTGKSSGGPPGTITIGRGLETIRGSVLTVAIFRRATKR